MGNIEFIPIDRTTDYKKWLKYRDNGVGASDAPILLGYNSYKCNLELFYEKVQGTLGFQSDSLDLWDGLEQEPITSKMFEYFSGTKESISANYRMGIQTRKCREVKGYYINSDYQNLYVSLDRIIEQFGEFKSMSTEGALELKNTKNSILSKYENRINPSNIVQNLIQIFVMEYDFGVTAYRVESDYSHGKTYEEHPILDPKNYQGIVQNVVEQLQTFWRNVEEGRKIHTEMAQARFAMNMKKAAELERELASLEPPAQNTEAYLKFYSERYKNRRTVFKEIKGTEEQYNLAKRINDLTKEIDALEEEKRGKRIRLLQSIDGAEIVKFDDKKTITYKPNVNGDRRLIINF